MHENVQYISFLLPSFLVQFTKYLVSFFLLYLDGRNHICQTVKIPHGPDAILG